MPSSLAPGGLKQRIPGRHDAAKSILIGGLSALLQHLMFHFSYSRMFEGPVGARSSRPKSLRRPHISSRLPV